MKIQPIACVLALSLTLSVSGAFAPPTEEQIAAAAAAPQTALAGLLADASAIETAGVVASVIEAIVNRGLEAAEQSTLLNNAIRVALDALPADGHSAFLGALGYNLADLALPDGVVTALRATITERVGEPMSLVFDNGFETALTGGGFVLPPQPPDPEPEEEPAPKDNPEPPATDPYPGQDGV